MTKIKIKKSLSPSKAGATGGGRRKPSTGNKRVKGNPPDSEIEEKRPKVRDFAAPPSDFKHIFPPAIFPSDLSEVPIDRVAEIAATLIPHCGQSPIRATKMAFELLDLAAGGKNSLNSEGAFQGQFGYEFGVHFTGQADAQNRHAIKMAESQKPAISNFSEDEATFGERIETMVFREALKNLMPKLPRDYSEKKKRFINWFSDLVLKSDHLTSEAVIRFYEENGLPVKFYDHAYFTLDRWQEQKESMSKSLSGEKGGRAKKVKKNI